MKKDYFAIAMSTYEEFIEMVKDIYRLGAIQSHLSWDQQTIMPAKGASSRAEILSWLAGEVHKRLVDPELNRIVSELESKIDTLDPDMACNVSRMRREIEQATLLPAELIEEMARLSSESRIIWAQAREESDFSIFAPMLEKIISITKQKMRYLGGEDASYDVLLDEYEIGMKMSDYDPLFAGLKKRLIPLLEKIMAARANEQQIQIPEGMEFPIPSQEKFCKEVASRMGFDFEAGRLDITTHPFCSGLWDGDTRITTRYDALDPFSCLYAVMHEAGHGLYEQGLPSKHKLSPRGLAISLGVHESQSRLWENQIGRTTGFWKVMLDSFRKQFPEFPENIGPNELNRIANSVEPSFIRVEADEITYNMHVMLRYEIEKQIFEEDLPVEKIPQVWNSLFEEWFGIEVPEDRLGCLQDVHWSMAAFGYFPTYTLGNLYAAQLLEAMSVDLGDIDQIIAEGDWSSILQWLRTNIHHQGSVMTPAQLIESATGKAPSPDAFIRYIESKYGELYSLSDY